MKQILQHLLTIGKFKLLKVPKLIKPKWLLGRDVSLNLSLMVLSTAILTLESTAQNLPKVPVSPETASLMKLVNYPVNLNTGQTDISIPLYNIEAGGLTLPINLSYHSGGFKIHEKATSIGLGWSHSADLQITRSINGLDDFGTGGYIANSKMKVYNGSSTTNYPFYDPSPSGPFTEYEAYRMAFGETDGMPDKFSYKLLNKSGTFYFRKNGAGTSAVIVAVPYDNIKISYANNQFTIVDTDGTTYVYGQQGAVTTTTVASQAVEISNNKMTAWKCIRIDNPTKTESINFTYAAKSVVKYITNVQSVEYYNSETPCGLDSYFMSDLITSHNPGITSYEAILDYYPFYSLSSPKYTENFADGTSRFHMPYLNSSNQPVDKTFTKIATLPTTEIYGTALSKIDFNGGSAVFTGADQLSSIKIQNASLEEIRTFTFFQSYTAPNYLSAAQQKNGPSFLGTRYLDSIQTRNGGVNYGSYKLLYGNKICFGSHLQGSDAWGYYNINTKEMTTAPNYLSIPSQTITQKFYTSITGGCPYVNNVNFTFGNLINLELVEQN